MYIYVLTLDSMLSCHHPTDNLMERKTPQQRALRHVLERHTFLLMPIVVMGSWEHVIVLRHRDYLDFRFR